MSIQVVTDTVTKMLGVVPQLCADRITATVCAEIRETMRGPLRNRLVALAQGTDPGGGLSNDQITAVLQAVANDATFETKTVPDDSATVVPAVSPPTPQTGGRTRRRTTRTRTRTRTRGTRPIKRLRGGQSAKPVVPPSKPTHAPTDQPSSPAALTGALVGHAMSAGPSSLSSAQFDSLQQMVERVMSNALADVAKSTLANVVTDLEKLTKDGALIERAVQTGIDRLLRGMAEDPEVRADVRVTLGKRIDAVLAALPDRTLANALMHRACPPTHQ